MDEVERWAPPGWPADPGLWAEARAAYASAGRHYHTWAHVADVARWFGIVAAEGPGWRSPVDVFCAVLAHDAVYDVTRADNEAASAELARRWCHERLGRDPEAAVRMVLATAGHGAPPPSGDADLLSFLDCDLAILGAAPDGYDRYAAGVEAEYTAFLPVELYRAGRKRFLERMVAQEHLFHTPFFRARLGDAARANLRRELARRDQAESPPSTAKT
jgi:predicted metal-dependent HD superfamily phosphohydrolase